MEEEAATEGLALVKCYGNTTGYKQVTQKGPGCFYALVYPARGKKTAGKRRTLGPYDTPEGAALAVARDQGWGPEKKCECSRCIALAAPPAPTSLTETEVLAWSRPRVSLSIYPSSRTPHTFHQHRNTRDLFFASSRFFYS